MVEIYGAAGVAVEFDTFRGAELEARRVLHERIDQGSNGTEPALWREYFTSLYALSGVPEDAVEGVIEGVKVAHAEAHLWTYALPDTGEVIESLKSAGYRVGVISNADGRMEKALVAAGVREHFEFVIDSGAVGFEKPGAEIFHAGCASLGLAPSECLYVGDLFPVDYVGATEAGLSAVLLDPLGLHGARAETVRALVELEPWLAGAS